MRTSLASQKGVASIEFALGFFAFWLMCMAWAEMSYMSYVSAIGDIAIAEASREAKVAPSTYQVAFDYQVAFENALQKEGAIWSTLVDTDNFSASVVFHNTVGELVAYDKGMSVCTESCNSAIAIYQLDYKFTPIFTYFLGEQVFSREVIVIQEQQLVSL